MPLFRAEIADSFDATCQAADAVGSLVYSKSDFEVETIDILDAAKMPAIGVITEKITTTTCVVQVFGPLEIAGLTAGARYWAGASAVPVDSHPTPGSGQVVVAQVVGVAISTDELLLDPELQAQKLRG